MKRLLFLMLSTLCAASFAQLPDYVPTEGLVGWVDFDSTWPAELGEVALSTDRFENDLAALELNDVVVTPFNGIGGNAARTVCFWARRFCAGGNLSRPFVYWGDPNPTQGVNSGYGFDYNGSGVTVDVSSAAVTWAHGSNYSIETWNHYAFVLPEGSTVLNDYQVYENGELLSEKVTNYYPNTLLISTTNSVLFGTFPAIEQCGDKPLLDDVGIWNRALTQGEIAQLFTAPAPAPGCTDESACNFNEADVDDGSCVFPPTIGLGEDIEACEDSVVLDAGEGFNFYEWSTGEITQTIVVTETGEYAVSASNVIENKHALQFNGTDAAGAPAEPILFGMESFSVSVDCKLNAFKGNDSEPYSYIIGHPLTQGTGDHGFKIQTAGTSLNGGFQVHINDEGTTYFNVISFDNGMETNVELDQWYDLTMVVDRNNAQFSFYVDGILIETQTIHPDFGNVDHPNGMSLGVQSIHGSSLLNGDLDNLQIWDVALSAEEVAHWQTTVPSGSETGLVGYWNFEEGEGDEANDLSQVAPTIALNNVGWSDNTPSAVFDASCAASDTIQVSWLIRGCTDPEACNYVEDASCDDGTCASCEALQTACGPGTIWDAEMQMCIGDGSGDINLDGCVQLNDLLDLLSAYGNCASEESAWQCGETLEYQGYDYATVQIGEQCWFAENARYLPEVSFVETGSETDGSPHAYVYGYSGNALEEAMATESYENFGGLYNFEAVQEWALCPAGWHVPTDDEFKTMESNVGLPQQELEGTAWRGEGLAVGNTLRSDDLWNAGAGVESGTVGYEGRPSGYRISWLGDEYFEAAGQYGAWWTSSMSGGKGWQRGIANYNLGIYRTLEFKQVGFAVRCIKNAE